MAQDLLTTYKYGWKTSYYQNTNDMKSDELDDKKEALEQLLNTIDTTEEEDCESCKI
jgi:ribonucleoside-diphosphate reductase alpha chain